MNLIHHRRRTGTQTSRPFLDGAAATAPRLFLVAMATTRNRTEASDDDDEADDDLAAHAGFLGRRVEMAEI